MLPVVRILICWGGLGILEGAGTTECDMAVQESLLCMWVCICMYAYMDVCLYVPFVDLDFEVFVYKHSGEIARDDHDSAVRGCDVCCRPGSMWQILTAFVWL